jgi:hypothetical protein
VCFLRGRNFISKYFVSELLKSLRGTRLIKAYLEEEEKDDDGDDELQT